MKKGEVANFVEKLGDILDAKQYSDIISWTPEGDAFVIKSITKLSDQVLPKFFKHSNFSSFNRQLNMYNFIKVRCETDEIVYKNEYFLRNDKSKYKEIRRQSKYDRQQQNNIITPYNQPQGILAQLREIGQRQYRLQNICKNIFNENQTIINDNAKLWKKVNQKLDCKSKQLSALFYFLLLKSDNKQLIHNLPLMDNYEIMPQQSDNNNSDSSDGQQIVDHNNTIPKNYNKQIMNLFENKNLNIQDLLTYFSDDKLKEKGETTFPIESPIQQPNLCIKQNGQSSMSQKSMSQKQPSIISDMNYFLNNSNKQAKYESDDNGDV